MVEGQREMTSQKDRDEARYIRLINNTKPFFVNKDSSKEKPLFGRATSVSNITERGPSGQSQKDGEIGDIGDGMLPSRIPRRSSYSPDVGNSLSKKFSAGVVSLTGAYNRALKEEEQKNSHPPNPESSPLSKGAAGRVSISGAYIKAEEEEYDIFGAPEKQGSPSPAPRPRIRSQESDAKRMAAIRRGFIRPITAPIPEIHHGIVDDDAATTESEGSFSDPAESLAGSNDSTIERKLDQYGRDLALRDKIIHGRPSLNRKSSGSNIEGEPLVAKPGSWGSKARLGSSWMRKILSPDDSADMQEAEEKSSVNLAVAGPDALVSFSGDDTSIQEPTPPHSPSSAQPNTASPLKSQVWDAELDFTAKSLAGYGTSPQMNIRSSKIAEVTAREIETLSRRAVATSRLEEIRERNSESPELTRFPSREFPKRSSPSETSSTRENSPSLRRRDSEASLRNQSSEVSSPEIPDTNSNEMPSRSSLGNTRSLTRDEIATALKPTTTKMKLRRSSSSKESWELVGTSHGELAKRSTLELTEEVENEINSKDQPQPSSEEWKLRSSSKESTSIISPSKPQESEEEQFHEKTILEEEGEHIPGTPITIFYGAAKDQPNHKRGESWQNLQKLAKALSSSPRVPSEEQKPKEESKVESSKLRDFVPVDAKRLSATSTSPKSDIDPEERIAAEASLFDLPENNKSERNSLRAPSPDYYPHDADETPRPKRDPLSMPTPVVTGAYIETPATVRQPKKTTISTSVVYDDVTNPDTARLAANIAIKQLVRGSNSESSQTGRLSSRSSRNQADGPLSSHSIDCTARPKSATWLRPPIINTANPSSAADDLRKIQQEAQVEDSTLDDFGDVLDASDDSDMNSPVDMEFAADLESDERGRPLSDLERERRREALVYERLNKGLKSGLLSIRDARRGIERLEDRVSSSPNLAVTLLQNDKIKSQSLASQDSSTIVYFAIPIPRLWIWTGTKKWGISPTWLGLIVGLIFGWLLTETITCEYVCKPTYASVNNWSPGDPLWGMALPTLANRMTGGVLVIISKVGREFIDWVWSVWSGAAETRKTATVAAKQVWNSWDSGSMLEDERV